MEIKTIIMLGIIFIFSQTEKDSDVIFGIVETENDSDVIFFIMEWPRMESSLRIYGYS
jgi:hypothetical protein